MVVGGGRQMGEAVAGELGSVCGGDALWWMKLRANASVMPEARRVSSE